jgi:hypothetical protein
MNTAAIRVGRLLEVRALAYKSSADVAALATAIGSELARVPSSTPIVAATDWRHCPLMSSDVAEQAVTAMMKNNPRLLRSGALASRDSPLAMLQPSRLVRETRHESRRLFFDEDELTRWLGEVLSEPEKARLREFLQEPAR